jgi:hypothetical protein
MSWLVDENVTRGSQEPNLILTLGTIVQWLRSFTANVLHLRTSYRCE